MVLSFDACGLLDGFGVAFNLVVLPFLVALGMLIERDIARAIIQRQTLAIRCDSLTYPRQEVAKDPSGEQIRSSSAESFPRRAVL